MPWETEAVKKVDPPCETCRPELRPDNAPAMEVWSRCGDEWITIGESGMRITIPGPSIESALNITGINDPVMRRVIFDQVKLVSRSVAKAMNEERMKAMEDRRNG